MVRGFYNLGSGIMVSQKKLSNIGNNIANVETPGYKKQIVSSATFSNMVINRLENGQSTSIGNMNYSTVVAETYTVHSEGALNTSGDNLDYAIEGSGFFALQGNNGIVYTRNGDFSIDEQGYLVQSNNGRVLGADGNPILVGTDDISSDSSGNISVNGQKIGQIGVYDFDDYAVLRQVDQGYYTAAGNTTIKTGTLKWQSLEGSNVDMADEMTTAISTQRDLQSQVQILKMYDSVLEKATTQLGKIT